MCINWCKVGVKMCIISTTAMVPYAYDSDIKTYIKQSKQNHTQGLVLGLMQYIFG